MSFFFTHQERTVKKHTVGSAVTQATAVLNLKNPTMGICMDAVGTSSLDEKITTEQLSDLIEEIVKDSLFYAR